MFIMVYYDASIICFHSDHQHCADDNESVSQSVAAVNSGGSSGQKKKKRKVVLGQNERNTSLE